MSATPILSLVAAYLLGSVPFSYLVARGWGVDVRRAGSGNVGATNVLRTTGRLAGLLALGLDAVKGMVAVVLTRAGNAGEWLPAAAALAAVLGHMYPVWLRFRGGKGVATGAGAFLPLLPWATAGGVAVFGLVLAVTRYVSLGSMAGAVSLAGFGLIARGPGLIPASAALVAGLIVWRHRGNIVRIVNGTEGRLGRR